MLTLPGLKVQQFAREFYLLNLVAADVERLVRFEVLGQSGTEGKAPEKNRNRSSTVNWAEIERKVETSEKAYQRPILRKKLDELADYYLQCRDDGALPAIPGAVLLTTDEAVTFVPQGDNPFVGLLQLSGEDSTLRVLDGQHRLLALSALLGSRDLPESARAAARLLQVPAILFTGLPPPAIVEMFVTINSKHTRLNPSLLFSLKGKQLYADALDARIHDVIEKLNSAESSPLKGQIKMLGVGSGKVAQAGLAQELRRTIQAITSANPDAAWLPDFREHIERFYLAYFKQVARCFEQAWADKRYSILSLAALRAFIQASQHVVVVVWARGGDPRKTLAELLGPWQSRIGSARFETAGQWRAKMGGGGKETTRALARELVAALGGRE
ncbi:MAG: DGQHR domain-containing protein [Myxococcales bacterium]|nr:DGQHR domain-containing protein [Myxococcales bacterium]